MKSPFVMITMMSVVMALSAQNTMVVRGVVLDGYGNPLPGSKVQAYNATESDVTDMDGTFELVLPRNSRYIVATYSGYRKSKHKIEDRTKYAIIWMTEKIESDDIYQYKTTSYASNPFTKRVIHKISSKSRRRAMSEAVTPIALPTKTVRGVVVDKTNNPIAGAYVETTNGPERVEVEPDGTFMQEFPKWLLSVTISCPGYRSKEILLRPNDTTLYVKLKKKLRKR